jgi:conjugal transfer/type IV secretion protein DotA/TraY
MKKYILLVILSCLAVSGFADTIATTQHTSVFGLGCAGAPFACTLLGKVFGNISPLYAHDGVLNQVMQVINVALCAFIGIYCGYASISSVHEVLKGGLQNAQMQLAMPFFRLALSTSLLIPIPGSGYSSYQTIVMNVAVAGADLANQVWNTAVQSLVSGLRISPMTNGEKQNFTSNSASGSTNNIAGLYNTSNGTPYDTNSGGLAAVQNYSYTESLFNHALCYEEQKAAAQVTADQSGVNSGSGFIANNFNDATGTVSLDSLNHVLEIPTIATGGSTGSANNPCLQGGETIATDDNKNYYIKFSTIPSGYATSTNQVVLAASDNMALNIYAMMDTLAQQVVSYQQKYHNNTDLFSIPVSSAATPAPGDATSVDAEVLGTNLGVQLAKAELSYAQTMQDIIYPAVENSLETRSNGGGSSGDDAAQSLSALGALLPSRTSSLQDTIQSNPMASFIGAGSFFFQLASANEKIDTNTAAITSSARKTNLVNTSDSDQPTYPLLMQNNYIAQQYHSFLFNIIGATDLGVSTTGGCSGNKCLFHLAYASKADADSALTSSSDNAYTVSAVNNASSILDANSQLVKSLTGSQQGADSFDTGSNNFNSQVTNLTTAIIPFAGDMVGIMDDFSLKTPNPWEYVQNIGSNLVGFALGIIIVPPLVLGMIELGVGGGMLNCFAGVQALVDKIAGSIRPLMMAIGCMSLVSGLILLFLVPMTPYIMYTLGIIGWLFLVVESVVAAPLVAILVSHPEGHHFWGKSEVALTLLLNLFIYPTLLVLGVIVSIALIYVSLNLVNLTFAAAMINTHFNMLNADNSNTAITLSNSFFGAAGTPSIATSTVDKSAAFSLVAKILMASSTNSANNAALMTIPVFGIGGIFIKAMAALLSLPVVVVLYTSLVMMVVKQCSNLIFILPSKVSRWIGVQGEQSDVGQQIQGLGQEIEKKGQPISRFNLPDGKSKGGAKKTGGDKAGDKDSMGAASSEGSDTSKGQPK